MPGDTHRRESRHNAAQHPHTATHRKSHGRRSGDDGVMMAIENESQDALSFQEAVDLLLKQPADDFMLASRMLITVLHNLWKKPHKEKFKKLRTDNPVIQEIISIPFVHACLTATKFQKQSKCYLLAGAMTVAEVEENLETLVEARKSLGLMEAWEIFPTDLELGDKIGSGKFGAVFDGQWNGQKVAIKTLKKHSEEGMRDFEREASVMIELRHQNVLSLLGVVLTQQPALIILELMGASFLQLLKKCELQDKDTLDCAMQVAAGLDYVHHKGFLHCDIACRNVLVSPAGHLKIADFGLARKIGSPECNLKGTKAKFPIRWTAPEVFASQQLSKASDIWSYGILFWEICSAGDIPYAELTNKEAKKAVKSGRYPSRPKNCREEFYSIMAACWSFDPDERPAFQDIVQTLLSSKIKIVHNTTDGREVKELTRAVKKERRTWFGKKLGKLKTAVKRRGSESADGMMASAPAPQTKRNSMFTLSNTSGKDSGSASLISSLPPSHGTLAAGMDVTLGPGALVSNVIRLNTILLSEEKTKVTLKISLATKTEKLIQMVLKKLNRSDLLPSDICVVEVGTQNTYQRVLERDEYPLALTTSPFYSSMHELHVCTLTQATNIYKSFEKLRNKEMQMYRDAVAKAMKEAQHKEKVDFGCVDDDDDFGPRQSRPSQSGSTHGRHDEDDEDIDVDTEKQPWFKRNKGGFGRGTVKMNVKSAAYECAARQTKHDSGSDGTKEEKRPGLSEALYESHHGNAASDDDDDDDDSRNAGERGDLIQGIVPQEPGHTSRRRSSDAMSHASVAYDTYTMEGIHEMDVDDIGGALDTEEKRRAEARLEKFQDMSQGMYPQTIKAKDLKKLQTETLCSRDVLMMQQHRILNADHDNNDDVHFEASHSDAGSGDRHGLAQRSQREHSARKATASTTDRSSRRDYREKGGDGDDDGRDDGRDGTEHHLAAKRQDESGKKKKRPSLADLAESSRESIYSDYSDTSREVSGAFLAKAKSKKKGSRLSVYNPATARPTRHEDEREPTPAMCTIGNMASRPVLMHGSQQSSSYRRRDSMTTASQQSSRRSSGREPDPSELRDGALSPMSSVTSHSVASVEVELPPPRARRQGRTTAASSSAQHQVPRRRKSSHPVYDPRRNSQVSEDGNSDHGSHKAHSQKQQQPEESRAKDDNPLRHSSKARNSDRRDGSVRSTASPPVSKPGSFTSSSGPSRRSSALPVIDENKASALIAGRDREYHHAVSSDAYPITEIVQHKMAMQASRMRSSLKSSGSISELREKREKRLSTKDDLDKLAVLMTVPRGEDGDSGHISDDTHCGRRAARSPRTLTDSDSNDDDSEGANSYDHYNAYHHDVDGPQAEQKKEAPEAAAPEPRQRLATLWSRQPEERSRRSIKIDMNPPGKRIESSTDTLPKYKPSYRDLSDDDNGDYGDAHSEESAALGSGSRRRRLSRSATLRSATGSRTTLVLGPPSVDFTADGDVDAEEDDAGVDVSPDDADRKKTLRTKGIHQHMEYSHRPHDKRTLRRGDSPMREGRASSGKEPSSYMTIDFS